MNDTAKYTHGWELRQSRDGSRVLLKHADGRSAHFHLSHMQSAILLSRHAPSEDPYIDMQMWIEKGGLQPFHIEGKIPELDLRLIHGGTHDT